MHEGRREQVRRQLRLTDPEEQAAMDRARAAEAARHARKEERRQELLSDRDYRIILWADKYMDRYGGRGADPSVARCPRPTYCSGRQD